MNITASIITILISTAISTTLLFHLGGIVTKWRASNIDEANKKIESLNQLIVIRDATITDLNQHKDALRLEISNLKTQLLKKGISPQEAISTQSVVDYSWENPKRDRILFNGKILKKVFDPAAEKDRFIFLMKNGEIRVPEHIYSRYRVGEYFKCNPESCYPI